MIELKKLENVSAIAIVIAFFLPWVNLGFISFSGHDLPNLWDAVNSLSNAFSETENVSAGVNYYLVVYLVPILALVFLLLEYLGKPSKNFAIVISAINIVAFLYILIFKSEGELGIFGVGIWITVLASLLMLLCSLGVVKSGNSE